MPDAPLRIVFAGTPEFSATHLKSLIDSEHQLLAVYTQPDRRAGRGKKMQSSPVKEVAVRAGLRVLQPPSLKDGAVQQELAALEADLLIVVAYGLILPQAVLDATRLGCINVHASLLPRWRGAAPIQRAIEAGDSTTGITIMQMDEGLDTGDMLATISCPINAETTAASLHDELALIGPRRLLEVLNDITTFQSHARPQRGEAATYAHKLSKAEAQIDWSQSAAELDRKIRAFNPFPVCHSSLAGQRIRIWQARPVVTESRSEAPGSIVQASEEGIVVCCGQGQLVIETLQLAGGKPLAAHQVLNAQPRREQFAPGKYFDALPAEKN